MSPSFFVDAAAYDYGAAPGRRASTSAGVDYEVQDAGEQPGLRYYDEADRNRSRASVNLSANPTDKIVVLRPVRRTARTSTWATSPSRPGREQFGLLNQDFTAWNVGANVNVSEHVAFGRQLRQRRVQLAAEVPQREPAARSRRWTDPNRNWTLDNDERSRTSRSTWTCYQLADAVDVRFSYDFSDSDNALVHGGPRIASLAATAPGQFIPLPNVTNTWNRFMADLKWYFTRQVGVGLGYYYEKLDVFDYATIDANGSVAFKGETGTPRIDNLGALITGYGARPYDGQNVYVRLLYRF